MVAFMDESGVAPRKQNSQMEGFGSNISKQLTISNIRFYFTNSKDGEYSNSVLDDHV
ncbi:MAG: hypothetical protein ACYSYV_12100 [Planctomycetota bacterium]|jgi:hypothetical protein